MSTEMSQQKEMELEELAKQEAEDRRRMALDRCPHCGAYVKDFTYFHPFLMRLGLFICNTCGVVFAPLSLRESVMRQKLSADAPTIITPGM
jgi:hypothetical protein